MKADDFKDHVASIKAAADPGRVADALGLRRKGQRFFCPDCQPAGGKTPDLVIGAGGFYCHKCGSKGDMIGLVQKAGGMDFKGAVGFLEGLTGMQPTKGWSRHTAAREIADPGASWKAVSTSEGAAGPKAAGIAEIVDHSDLYSAFLATVCQPIQGTPGADYLVGRGIGAAVADQYGVRYCPDLAGLWSLADRAKIKSAGLSSLYVFQKAGLPVLAFPYIRHGRPVFIKTRCLLSKDEADRRQVTRFLNTAGRVPCLWNHDAVAAAAEVLVCEGEIDALTAVCHGFAAVGLPGWSHWKDAWTADFAGKDVILVLDADVAGQKGTADIARRFLKAGLPCPRQLVLTAGKDLNDAIMAFLKAGKTE